MKKLLIILISVFLLSSCQLDRRYMTYLNDTFKNASTIIKLDNTDNYLVVDSSYIRIVEVDGVFGIYHVEKLKIKK